MHQTLIYRKLQKKGYKASKVAEVGVYLPQTSNILGWILDGTPVLLVEPDPRALNEIHTYFAGRDNITLIPYAVGDESGELSLVQAGASTYASNLPASPAMVNDGSVAAQTTQITVKCVRFNEIDPGDIAVLSIDIEGGEWFVIKHMKSRPDVISIETHAGLYRNPFMSQLAEWLAQHDYIIWFKDGSDSVYIKQGLFEISRYEKLQLFLKNIKIRYKRLRKQIRAGIKSLLH